MKPKHILITSIDLLKIFTIYTQAKRLDRYCNDIDFQFFPNPLRIKQKYFLSKDDFDFNKILRMGLCNAKFRKNYSPVTL